MARSTTLTSGASASNDLTEGDYTLIKFHADPTQIAELDRVMRITDAVIRHMIVRRDDQE